MGKKLTLPEAIQQGTKATQDLTKEVKRLYGAVNRLEGQVKEMQLGDKMGGIVIALNGIIGLLSEMRINDAVSMLTKLSTCVENGQWVTIQR